MAVAVAVAVRMTVCYGSKCLVNMALGGFAAEEDVVSEKAVSFGRMYRPSNKGVSLRVIESLDRRETPGDCKVWYFESGKRKSAKA